MKEKTYGGWSLLTSRQETCTLCPYSECYLYAKRRENQDSDQNSLGQVLFVNALEPVSIFIVLKIQTNSAWKLGNTAGTLPACVMLPTLCVTLCVQNTPHKTTRTSKHTTKRLSNYNNRIHSNLWIVCIRGRDSFPNNGAAAE